MSQWVDDSMVQISEIYKSLQGESTHAGLPCVFVRLTGCNLRCSWCDSEFSFYGGRKMTLQEVLCEIARLSPAGGLVEITGGEPMLQEREVIPLMEQLLDADYQVLLETSGERPLARVPKQVIKIVDVKCPHSGEPNTFALENLKALRPHDELKFVLTDRTDYEFARDFVQNHGLAERVHAILFSPHSKKPPPVRATLRTASSIRRNWRNGSWPTTFRRGSACKSTN